MSSSETSYLRWQTCDLPQRLRQKRLQHPSPRFSAILLISPSMSSTFFRCLQLDPRFFLSFLPSCYSVPLPLPPLLHSSHLLSSPLRFFPLRLLSSRPESGSLPELSSPLFAIPQQAPWSTLSIEPASFVYWCLSVLRAVFPTSLFEHLSPGHADTPTQRTALNMPVKTSPTQRYVRPLTVRDLGSHADFTR